jgi:hypothetical protein
MILRRVLKTGRVPSGIQLPENALPKPGVDARAEAEALRAAIRMVRSHSGPTGEHPLGVRLNLADWERFHCVHCAHHLSFAIPTKG